MDGCLFLLLRIAYFVVIGLPLGAIVLHVAWLCMVTMIGIPVGLWLFNRIPLLMTLAFPPGEKVRLELEGRVFVAYQPSEQHSFCVRLPWLVLVGWWASLLWCWAAFLAAASVVGLPLAFWMFTHLPSVMFLTRG